MTRDWLDSEGNFLFGKYQGEHPTDLAYENPGYLKWILETVEEDISEEDRGNSPSFIGKSEKEKIKESMAS